jgi:hypothetical protein
MDTTEANTGMGGAKCVFYSCQESCGSTGAVTEGHLSWRLENHDNNNCHDNSHSTI